MILFIVTNGKAPSPYMTINRMLPYVYETSVFTEKKTFNGHNKYYT